MLARSKVLAAVARPWRGFASTAADFSPSSAPGTAPGAAPGSLAGSARVERLRLPWAAGAAPSWSLQRLLGGAEEAIDAARLEQLAWLAHIELPAEERARQQLAGELGSMLRFARHVSVAAAAPAPGDEPEELLGWPALAPGDETPLRADEVTEGEIADSITGNAARLVDGHFVVPKV